MHKDPIKLVSLGYFVDNANIVGQNVKPCFFFLHFLLNFECYVKCQKRSFDYY